MKVKMNIKVLTLIFLLSACTSDNGGFYQHVFEPCNIKSEKLSNYPKELDSLVRNQLETSLGNKFTLDSMGVQYPVNQNVCELDSTRYGVHVFISTNNNSQVWLLLFRKRDWFNYYKEKLK